MKNLRKIIQALILEDATAFHKELKAKNLGSPPKGPNRSTNASPKQMTLDFSIIKAITLKKSEE